MTDLKCQRLNILIGLMLMLIVPFSLANKSCSYDSYFWNSKQRAAVDYYSVEKPYANISEDEIDQFTGCTVCVEDQQRVEVPPLKSFQICHILADSVFSVLRTLIAQGQPVFQVTGYRVGKTRGELDEQGNRTQFSNHAYGIALDINTHLNGLYDNCITFGEPCRLIKGGPWQPNVPGGLKINSPIVRAFASMQLQWGGQILGKQKDFMHFSPTGY